MKRKILLKALLLTPAINLTGLFFSCTSNNNNVSFVLKDFYTTADSQIIKINVKNAKIKYINATILNSSTHFIFVSNPTIEVKDGIGELEIKIDSSTINNPIKATFDLNLTYLSEKEKIIGKEKHEGFSIYYPGYQEERKDRVIIPFDVSPNQVLYGTYHATFTFYCLTVPPQSDVTVEMTEVKNVLTLKTTKARVEKDPTPATRRWKIMVDIDVPYSQCFTEIFNITIKLTFLNSYNLYQTNTFENLILKYVRGTQKVIDTDYFDIRNGVLWGFKPSISLLRLTEDYEILEIPEGITRIRKEGFCYPDEDGNYSRIYFRNIRKIKFPTTLKFIESQAFYGFNNVFEMDFTDYKDDEIPEWFGSSTDIFNYNDTQISEELKFKNLNGYIWTNYKDFRDEKYTKYIASWGLPETWITCLPSLVTPKEIYKCEEKVIDDQKYNTIVGIQTPYIDTLWQYGIIRIPDDVEAIDPFVFRDAFSMTPYFRNKDANNLWTRRLILGRNLKKVRTFAFKNAGIGGPLFIPSCLYDNPDGLSADVIQPFETDVFYNIGQYDEEFSPATKYNQEPVQIEFEESNNVVDIPDRFIYTPAERKDFAAVANIKLPKYVRNIGMDAFNVANYNKPIVFPSSLETIGDGAFEQCNLTGELVLPELVKKVGKKAFTHNSFTKIIINSAHKEPKPTEEGKEQEYEYFFLDDIGEYAFGGENCTHTMIELDISIYSNATMGAVHVPAWLQAKDKHYFDNMWNVPVSGKNFVYISVDMKSKSESDILQIMKDYGMPESTWNISTK